LKSSVYSPSTAQLEGILPLLFILKRLLMDSIITTDLPIFFDIHYPAAINVYPSRP
jgi:hypothetical protein